ncbi:MAG: hypothetical protein WDN49_24665 [Acetobacteraceae bacterium]
MKYVEKLGGQVTYVRMRSQRVRSKNRRTYAIERDSNTPAMQGSSGDFVFSEKGAGVFPIAIYADTIDLVFQAMRKSTAGFVIENKGALREDGFAISARVTNFKDMPLLEIHDADKQIIKDIHRVVRGAIPLAGSHASFAQQILETVKGGLNAPLTYLNAREKVGEVNKAFGPAGTKAGVGVIVHMMAGTGFASTEKKAATLPEVWKMLDYNRRIDELVQALGL